MHIFLAPTLIFSSDRALTGQAWRDHAQRVVQAWEKRLAGGTLARREGHASWGERAMRYIGAAILMLACWGAQAEQREWYGIVQQVPVTTGGG